MWSTALGSISLVLLAVVARITAGRYTRLETARARMRAELVEARWRRTEAQIRALKAELNPHFLGNALQGVKALARTDPGGARQTLGRLADYLRAALQRADIHETRFRDEIDSLQPFIEVERARLRGNLEASWDVEPDLLDAYVPDMVLQPLVENAVKHGLMPMGGGRVMIRARAVRSGDRLEISVEDDGVSLGTIGTSRASPSGGVGLTNVCSRLAALYGRASSLELARAGLGTRVRITLPCRRDDDLPATAATLAESADSAGLHAGQARASAWRIGVTSMLWLYSAWFITSDNTLTNALSGIKGERTYLIVEGVVIALLFAAQAPLAFWIAKRWPLFRMRSWSVPSAALTIAGALAGVAAVCLGRIIVAATFDSMPWPSVANIADTAARVAPLSLGTSIIVQCYSPLRDALLVRRQCAILSSELVAARTDRTGAELRALKAELNPHFIGNALNAVSALITTDVQGAGRLLDHLTDLLSTIVDGAAGQEVTLQEELESLEPFLKLERLRLGEALKISVDADAATLRGRVPHLILQPLVENAVKHGMGQGRAGGNIEVSARRGPRGLEVCVRDDGTGLVESREPVRSGVGLANTRVRLRELYGPAASLEVVSAAGGGALATVMIPWHEDVIRQYPSIPALESGWMVGSFRRRSAR